MKIAITNMCLDGNRGDLAILKGTVTAVRRAVPNAEISVLPMEAGPRSDLLGLQPDTAVESDLPLVGSSVPSRATSGMSSAAWIGRLSRAIVSERANQKWLEGTDDRRTRDALADSDLVIVKGGSWLFSYPTPQQAVFALRMLHHMRVAQRAGTPTVILGTSLGPWQRGTRSLYRTTLKRCDQIVVRERLSYEFARAHGLGNVALGVDMAFALKGPDAPAAASARRGVAITPRQLPYESSSAVERYKSALVDAARRLIDQHSETCFLATQVDLDLTLCEELARRIDRPSNVEIADYVNRFGIDDLIAWYGSRRIILGSRIHSVILAAIAGTSSVILECDPPKMVGISEQLGLDQWRLRAADAQVLQLPELATKALEASEATQASLAKRVEALGHRADRQVASALLNANRRT